MTGRKPKWRARRRIAADLVTEIAGVIGFPQAAHETAASPGETIMNLSRAILSAALALMSVTAFAADYPAPKQGEWIARDFKFHTGETMPELRLHYTTIGEPTGQPVLVLHGSGGSARQHADGGASPASCSVPASRSMPRNTTSSFPTASATANRQSRPTA